jgi:hypothetical protein
MCSCVARMMTPIGSNCFPEETMITESREHRLWTYSNEIGSDRAGP